MTQTGMDVNAVPDQEGVCTVYWPGAPRQGGEKPLARRLQTLDGKRIALLWGWLFRGDEVYELLQKALAERHAGISFIHWNEFGSIHGNDEREVVAALPEKLKRLGADAVLTAMGC